MQKRWDRWVTWTGLAIAAVIILSIGVKNFAPQPSAVRYMDQPSD